MHHTRPDSFHSRPDGSLKLWYTSDSKKGRQFPFNKKKMKKGYEYSLRKYLTHFVVE